MNKSRQTTRPIDGEKLKELVLSKGNLTDVSEDIGYSRQAILAAIRNNKITLPMATLLEQTFGIKYEAYKPEEKKEEPVKEKPKPETEVISKDEAQLKTIITQLSALNNGLTAIFKKLEEIDADLKVWEVTDGD